MSEKYTIDNAKNDIQNLQSQNSYDFQEIKRLDGIIKDYDKRILQAINFNNQINKKIEYIYENIKKITIDENASITLNNKIDDIKQSITDINIRIDKLPLTNIEQEIQLIRDSVTTLQGITNNLVDDEQELSNSIIDLQQQIDNLDIPEEVDLTEVNTKLTQLESKIIKNAVFISRSETYLKLTPSNSNYFSKILITDKYGGCLLITGSNENEVSEKTFKVIRLSNGNPLTCDASNNENNSIKNVYYHNKRFYIQVAGGRYYIEGGYDGREGSDTLPTGAVEMPVLDLTQGSN